jgi:hypothetical protein
MMDFKDAKFGQRVRVVAQGQYTGWTFKIEAPSSELRNGVIVANNIEERYMHFACSDLELVRDEPLP